MAIIKLEIAWQSSEHRNQTKENPEGHAKKLSSMIGSLGIW
jgi:hypothetical protein